MKIKNQDINYYLRLSSNIVLCSLNTLQMETKSFFEDKFLLFDITFYKCMSTTKKRDI